MKRRRKGKSRSAKEEQTTRLQADENVNSPPPGGLVELAFHSSKDSSSDERTEGVTNEASAE